jgi:hypothetical protein
LDSKLRDEVYNDTRKIISTIGISQDQLSSSHRITTKTSNIKRKKRKNFVTQEDVMEEFAGDVDDDNEEDDLDEVDRYIITKISFSKDNTILEWWNKHSLTFPQLSLLAKSLFGVPASSATSERVFSASGRVLEKRRQSLNPDNVDDILMIRNFRNI